MYTKVNDDFCLMMIKKEGNLFSIYISIFTR